MHNECCVSALIPISLLNFLPPPRRILEKVFPPFPRREKLKISDLARLEMSTAKPQKRDIQWADVIPRPGSPPGSNLSGTD